MGEIEMTCDYCEREWKIATDEGGACLAHALITPVVAELLHLVVSA